MKIVVVMISADSQVTTEATEIATIATIICQENVLSVSVTMIVISRTDSVHPTEMCVIAKILIALLILFAVMLISTSIPMDRHNTISIWMLTLDVAFNAESIATALQLDSKSAIWLTMFVLNVLKMQTVLI